VPKHTSPLVNGVISEPLQDRKIPGFTDIVPNLLTLYQAGAIWLLWMPPVVGNSSDVANDFVK